MSLPDSFIDEQLKFPLFDQARLQLGDVMNPAAVHYTRSGQAREVRARSRHLYTGWLIIKYPTKQYAISPQPVV